MEADATGVGLFDLEKDWLKDYPGRVYHRALELPRDISRADVSRKLMAFSREIKGRPYETNLLEMARAAGIFGVNEHANLSSLFCSELVAEVSGWGVCCCDFLLLPIASYRSQCLLLVSRRSIHT